MMNQFSMGDEQQPLVHVLLISYPGQGHINPLLRLAKRLASKGLLVTFTTTESFSDALIHQYSSKPGELIPVGDGFLRFDFIDDEWTPNDPRRHHMYDYLPQLETIGRRHIPEMLRQLADEGRPVSCLINNPFIPWVLDVADEVGLPCAMLWVQSCACFLTYYYYANGLVPFPKEQEELNSCVNIEIPTLPTFKWDEVPSTLHPTSSNPLLNHTILGQYLKFFSTYLVKRRDIVLSTKPFCVLMDTFDELEHNTLKFTSTICPIKPVGPLFKDPNKSDHKQQLIKSDCLTWLDTKPDHSVVYISFGTVVYLKQEQITEIAHALLSSSINFLWVMKPPYPGLTPHTLPYGFLDTVGDKGRVIVEYSPQEQVLVHRSVACFVTHCGWNSTMEAVSSGMPVVTFPQWGDQVTNSKYLVDVLGVGVRMCRGEHEDRIVSRDEVEKCLKEGIEGEVIRKSAVDWKGKAELAFSEGGSSDRNLEEFVDEVKCRNDEVTKAYFKFLKKAAKPVEEGRE